MNEVWLTLPLSAEKAATEKISTLNSTVNSTVNSTINGNKVENKVENSTINGNKVENKVENSTENPTQESEISISQKIFSLIQDHPDITIEEMVNNLGEDRNTINYQIKKLKDANLIERLGSKKTGKWKIISK